MHARIRRAIADSSVTGGRTSWTTFGIIAAAIAAAAVDLLASDLQGGVRFGVVALGGLAGPVIAYLILVTMKLLRPIEYWIASMASAEDVDKFVVEERISTGHEAPGVGKIEISGSTHEGQGLPWVEAPGRQTFVASEFRAYMFEYPTEWPGPTVGVYDLKFRGRPYGPPGTVLAQGRYEYHVTDGWFLLRDEPGRKD